ncbi:hypothetical protein PoB_001785600 [Plakobranchus ocellatus]|uniref:Uncharacterized protein n=1 Tax=Plakobranchus ocellatus TaxID=259542 RepID=A0AAV3Z642_9GAST|nr:hypothetical protein PoB_001785600 [Plakobranchus ocellatus]
MATSNDLLIKQRSGIEFLAAEGCSAANIHKHCKNEDSLWEMCISDCAVHKWVARQTRVVTRLAKVARQTRVVVRLAKESCGPPSQGELSA